MTPVAPRIIWACVPALPLPSACGRSRVRSACVRGRDGDTAAEEDRERGRGRGEGEGGGRERG